MNTEDRRAIFLTGGIITVAILLGCARRKRDPEAIGAGGDPAGYGGSWPDQALTSPGPTGGPGNTGEPGGSGAPGGETGGGGPGAGSFATDPNSGGGLTMSPPGFGAGLNPPMALLNDSPQRQSSGQRSVQPEEMPRAYVNWSLAEEDEEDTGGGLMTPYETSGLSQ